MRLRRRNREKSLFLTHTPWAYSVGQEVKSYDTGEPCVVTRLKELPPTTTTMGPMPCSEVFGKPAKEQP